MYKRILDIEVHVTSAGITAVHVAKIEKSAGQRLYMARTRQYTQQRGIRYTTAVVQTQENIYEKMSHLWWVSRCPLTAVLRSTSRHAGPRGRDGREDGAAYV